jgi:outer membrane murein-binding lipoprotein Lpp
MKTPTLPTIPTDVQAMLDDMLANATRQLEAQRERTRQLKAKQDKEEAIRAKKRIKEISRKILRG